MRKFIAILLAVCCCMNIWLLPCFAADDIPHIKAEVANDIVDEGESFYLTVDLSGNKCFGAMQYTITYDSTKLTLDSASAGALINNSTLSAINTGITGEINFSAISMNGVEGDGTTLVVKFTAKSAGVSDINLVILAYADRKGNSLNITESDAKVTVNSISPPTTEPEDDIVPPPVTEPEDDIVPPPVTEPEDDIVFPPVIPPGGDIVFPPVIQPGDDPEDDIILPPVIQPEDDSPKIAFPDVTIAHWAYYYIYTAADRKLFVGMDGGNFEPEIPMTRAMFVTVLYRYAGEPEAGIPEFADVAPNTWYSEAVAWAAENGIVYGVDAHNFAPDKHITRGEIVTMLCRYRSGWCSDIGTVFSYKDAATIPEWGLQATGWAIEKGIIEGRSGNKIDFGESATRAEAATIFVRFINLT